MHLNMTRKTKPSTRHHFISQFYLSGFTSDGTKDGDIYCFDLLKKCFWLTKTKDIAFENHFNDIDAEGVPVDELESKLSELEGIVSPVFAELRNNQRLPKGIELDKILNFIALMLVRNPFVRRATDEGRTLGYFKYLENQLSTEESWNKLKNKIHESGITALDNLSYSDALKKLLPRSVKIQGNPMSYHKYEFEKANEILPLLALRSWEVVTTSTDQLFISSDKCVTKIWTAPYPPPRNANGLLSIHSAMLFPVSSNTLLLGTFSEDRYKSITSLRNPPMVNNLIMTETDRFVYSSAPSFFILSKTQEVYSSDKYFTLFR